MQIKIDSIEYAIDKYEIHTNELTHDIILAPWGFHPKGRGYYKKCNNCKDELCNFNCYSVGETLVLRLDTFLEIKGIKKYLGYEKDYEIEVDNIYGDVKLIEQENVIGTEKWDYKFSFINYGARP